MERQRQLKIWARNIAQEAINQGEQPWHIRNIVENHYEIPEFYRETVIDLAEDEWEMLKSSNC